MAKRLFIRPSPLEGSDDPKSLIVRDVSMQRYLLDAVQQAMTNDGYGQRSRSAWVEEAIAGMIVHDPYLLDSVTGDRSVDGPLGKLIRVKVQLSRGISRQIEGLSIRLKRENPFLDGALSYAVRCAVRHRLRFPHLYQFRSAADIDQMVGRALEADLSDPG